MHQKVYSSKYPNYCSNLLTSNNQKHFNLTIREEHPLPLACAARNICQEVLKPIKLFPAAWMNNLPLNQRAFWWLIGICLWTGRNMLTRWAHGKTFAALNKRHPSHMVVLKIWVDASPVDRKWQFSTFPISLWIVYRWTQVQIPVQTSHETYIPGHHNKHNWEENKSHMGPAVRLDGNIHTHIYETATCPDWHIS